MGFVLCVGKSWSNHFRAVSQCLRALISRVSSPKLRRITFRLDLPNAKSQFEQIEFQNIITSLDKLAALNELVFVVHSSSADVARRSVTESFLRTPYLDMIRYESSETGVELPVSSLLKPLAPRD